MCFIVTFYLLKVELRDNDLTSKIESFFSSKVDYVPGGHIFKEIIKVLAEVTFFMT